MVLAHIKKSCNRIRRGGVSPPLRIAHSFYMNPVGRASQPGYTNERMNEWFSRFTRLSYCTVF